MPIVTLYGKACRAQPLLAAMGAQEALEHQGTNADRAKLAGPSAVAAHERDRMKLARQRNIAERALRPEEHAVWVKWRTLPLAEREALRAMLMDPPPHQEARTRRARP